MFATFTLVAASLCLAPPREPRDYGVCIWEHGVPDSVLDGLMACDHDLAVLEAEEEFGRHAMQHGWSFSWTPSIADSVVPRATCPSEVLDLLLRAQVAEPTFHASVLRAALADCLANSGRTDEALAVLDEQIAALRQLPPPDLPYFDGYLQANTQELPMRAASIAARAGRWELALRYSEGWLPVGAICGNAAIQLENNARRFRAFCQVELGRYDDARRACIGDIVVPGTLRDERSIFYGAGWEWCFDPCLLEMWIESYVREGDTCTASQIVSTWADLRGGSDRTTLEEAARHWEVLHMPIPALLDHSTELDDRHDDLLLPLLHGLSER